MARYSIVETQDDHLAAIAAGMRVDDVNEVAAMSGRDPLDALKHSMDRSDWSLTAMADGVPMCVFGVGTASLVPHIGVPWLLGTDLIHGHYRAFLRGSVQWRDRIAGSYGLLVNAVDTRNALSVRWLKWLGFTLHDPVPMGVAQIPFHPFELRSDHV